MAGANSNIQVTGLDFNDIKSNFITYLRGQDTFKDYNFEGSGLNVLLDVLAYNTQYNAYYLNQVANEMFLDSATQRSSVVSHAKLLSYTPQSAIAPSATINVTFTGVTSSALTLPAYSTFLSEAVDGVNYNFVNPESYTVNVSNNTAIFESVEIKQGSQSTLTFNVNLATNPSCLFEIPDSTIDTTTLVVSVRPSSTSTERVIFSPATNYLTLDGQSNVYFLQESLTGTYEIYFGDGIIGSKLSDGSVVNVTYLTTEGLSSSGANNFTLMDKVGNYTSTITGITPASEGKTKESLDQIKYQAPKSYAAQGRAVTTEDYITAIQQNKLGITFDAVNVWGGQQNDPPVYGQVFIALKPSGAYSLTQTQKQRLINEVIKPISVLTVEPTIVDTDYTYIKLDVNVYYDPNKTTLSASQLQSGLTTSIRSFANTSLNTFNSTFNAFDLLKTIQSYDSSIITSEYGIELQKKFFPNLTSPTTYKLLYNTSLEKGILLSGVNSNPSVIFKDPITPTLSIDGIHIEEVPMHTNGVESISVINPGYGYQYTPTVKIVGDGTGASAHAIVVNGSVKSIVIDKPGTGYTSASATIVPQTNDTTGQLATVVVNLEGRYGTLRSYYYNSNNIKTIFDENVGTIDYSKGVITLTSFGPMGVNNPLGQLTVGAKPTTSIISSTYNRIITVDPYDPNAVTVNVIAKTSK